MIQNKRNLYTFYMRMFAYLSAMQRYSQASVLRKYRNEFIQAVQTAHILFPEVNAVFQTSTWLFQYFINRNPDRYMPMKENLIDAGVFFETLPDKKQKQIKRNVLFAVFLAKVTLRLSGKPFRMNTAPIKNATFERITWTNAHVEAIVAALT